MATIVSCSTVVEQDFNHVETVATNPTIVKLSVDGECKTAFYQKDPYDLLNINATLEALACTKTVEASEGLAATDYAIKIYPRTETELYMLEGLEDIDISYLPFCYSLANAPAQEDQPSVPLEANPHKAVYHDLISSDGTIIGEQTISLPVVYAVWPVGKPIPEGLDYVIDYEVFLPNHSVLTKSSGTMTRRDLAILERAAIARSRGEEFRVTKVMEDPDSMYYRYIGGYIKSHDSITNSNIGLGKLYMKFQLGTNIVSSTTLPDGYFYFSCEIPDGARLSCSLRNSTWRITPENVDTPLEYSLCALENLMQDDPNISMDNNLVVDIPVRPKISQFSANYFYFGTHGVVAHTYGNPLRIMISPSISDTEYGVTTTSPTSQPFIKLFANSQPDHWMMCTVFHELGHATHYSERGGYYQYNSANQLMKESYATYVGWNCTRSFYASLGHNDYFTDLGYQRWTVGSSDYSPFFVDLIDTVNQSLWDDEYLVDNIAGVPHATIRSLISSYNSIEQCLPALRGLIGTYYTEADFNAYVSGFNS